MTRRNDEMTIDKKQLLSVPDIGVFGVFLHKRQVRDWPNHEPDAFLKLSDLPVRSACVSVDIVDVVLQRTGHTSNIADRRNLVVLFLLQNVHLAIEVVAGDRLLAPRVSSQAVPLRINLERVRPPELLPFLSFFAPPLLGFGRGTSFAYL